VPLDFPGENRAQEDETPALFAPTSRKEGWMTRTVAPYGPSPLALLYLL
jgi:hypothetical protein